MKIKSIKKINKVDVVYNLTVSNNNNYFANDILVSNCKNPNSQQGKGFLKLIPKERIALSGTPLMNSIEDLYIILKWLDYETHTFTQYKNHYCIFGGFGDHEILGYKNKSELVTKLKMCMLRRRKEDVLDLPEVNHIPVYLDMSKQEWSIYEEVKTALKKDIDLIKLSPNPLAQFTRLRQTTGYSGLLASNTTQSTKMDMMLQLIEDAVANDEKVVVFSGFTQIINEAYKRCKQYNPAIITGEVSIAKRDMEVEKFQNDETCKVILGNTSAMGTGITLTAGNNVVFLDEPWNEANKRQAYDRCHRIGTTKTVNVYTLLCENTIDEVVNEIVTEKGELASYFVDGKTSNRQFMDKLVEKVLGD
jgi:SNF2 family DNA or RNA helicase